jgi:hypothetical protein
MYSSHIKQHQPKELPAMAASTPTPPTIDAQARRWLRLEGLAVLIAAAVAFGQLGGEFIWFLPALLVPDLAITGYLGGPRSGAFVYNLVHNWAFGLAIAGGGLASGITPLALAGMVLIAHTGMDRAAGYGIKLASAFSDTHLGRIGKAARAARAGDPAEDRSREPAAHTVAR